MDEGRAGIYVSTGDAARNRRLAGMDDNATPLIVSVTVEGARVVVRPVGDVDLSTVSALADGLRTAAATDPGIVELDFGSVEMLDSSGIGVVMQAWESLMRRRGVPVVVTHTTPIVERVLQITGVWHLLQP
ncbi:MAG: anti-sigma factor antagonist [Acidimicrobiales bacterium]|nr:anti-sigma factor antagonist [Acidimicrobiales bacterium]